MAPLKAPWVRQAADHVVVINDLVCFYPFRSWGVILPSKNPSGDQRERIDVTELRGKSPKNTILTLHPEGFDALVKIGYITVDGELIPPNK